MSKRISKREQITEHEKFIEMTKGYASASFWYQTQMVYVTQFGEYSQAPATIDTWKEVARKLIG